MQTRWCQYPARTALARMSSHRGHAASACPAGQPSVETSLFAGKDRQAFYRPSMAGMPRGVGMVWAADYARPEGAADADA